TGTLSFVAGQTTASVSVPILGDFVLEGDEQFVLSISPSEVFSDSTAPYLAEATIVSDDLQTPPVAINDTFSVSRNTTLSRDAANGVLTNDSDIEGNIITAQLVKATTHGSLTLNADGSFSYVPNAGYLGNDSFTYRAYDGIGYSTPATVNISVTKPAPPFSGSLSLPDSLAPGEEGTATFRYTNVSGANQDGILVYVESSAALLRDPLTGQYSDKLLLIDRGDGLGPILGGETGVLSFGVKQGNAPLGRANITVSVVDPTSTLDTAALSQALRPAFMEEATWQRVYANLVSDATGSTNALVTALAENSALIASLGAEDSSATTALMFELEQAGDFGSIAERMTSGSLGDGWAFIGDIGLDINAQGEVAWTGSTNLDALFSLNSSSAAQY
ncbi:MAG TPA: Ig-like domain-containing protein, partial [Zoogloea sp.]|nr:Ig-like domain-containing protein [Zoogloea sp.]